VLEHIAARPTSPHDLDAVVPAIGQPDVAEQPVISVPVGLGWVGDQGDVLAGEHLPCERGRLRPTATNWLPRGDRLGESIPSTRITSGPVGVATWTVSPSVTFVMLAATDAAEVGIIAAVVVPQPARTSPTTRREIDVRAVPTVSALVSVL
jgi:hypothetical protein